MQKLTAWDLFKLISNLSDILPDNIKQSTNPSDQVDDFHTTLPDSVTKTNSLSENKSNNQCSRIVK